MNREKQVERAHRLVTMHGDADMSHEEVQSLLVENGVPEDVAQEVADDVRG